MVRWCPKCRVVWPMAGPARPEKIAVRQPKCPGCAAGGESRDAFGLIRELVDSRNGNA